MSNMTRLAIGALVAIAAHLILKFIPGFPHQQADYPLYVLLAAGAVQILPLLARNLWQREFGSDFLAGISIVTAVLLKEYLVASIVVLMLSGGTALEQFGTNRASQVLNLLAKRVPSVAHRKESDRMVDIQLKEVGVGDILAILPHEICPADGVVLEGQGSMNEAYLTEEPFEVPKAPGAQVISGSINGNAALIVRAEKVPADSRYASIMRVMEETQQRRPQLRRIGDLLGAWYTPLAVGIALLAWAIGGESARFLAVLVVATPCPLLIGIPVGVLGATSLSAQRGIIIKNPAVLEQIDSCRTFLFDKTGTLTYGQPRVTEIVCNEAFSESEVLTMAASLERYSKHPLAVAVREAAADRGLSIQQVSEVSERPGEGLKGKMNGREVWITGRNKLTNPIPALPPAMTGLECVVFLDQEYAALIRFEDLPRRDSRVFLHHLKPLHGVTRLLLVSGDREAEVKSLADHVGITSAFGAKSPEEKVALVAAETKNQKTVFVGDGINDAPAMQAATVGVAFGHENDITAEAADAVILERSLGKLDELMHISRRMRRIILESAIGGMAMSCAGMLLAAGGMLPAISGAIFQEFIDLVAVLNALRAAFPPKSLRDF